MTINGPEDLPGSDVAGAAYLAGYDLGDIIERCYRDQPGGLHDLFALSQVNLDGAAGPGYNITLVEVIYAVGDNRFGDQLAREPVAVQNAVRRMLVRDYSMERIAAFKSRFPVTYPADLADASWMFSSRR